MKLNKRKLYKFPSKLVEKYSIFLGSINNYDYYIFDMFAAHKLAGDFLLEVHSNDFAGYQLLYLRNKHYLNERKIASLKAKKLLLLK